MPYIRAFIAAEIDLANKHKISELISLLKKSNADVKWVNEEQMHITLKFLGNIEQDKIREISGTLSNITNNLPGFAINLSKIGAFPDMNRPRVIWIGIDKGAESLEILAEKIENVLKEIGTDKESHDFKAHLTLGRVRSPKNMSNLATLLGQTDFHAEEDIYIDEIVLFQSTLSPKGTTHTKLSTARLVKIQ